MEQLLSEQANVETMEKKLDEKFDPVVSKLDGILKGVEALQQENRIGAEQLRRHETPTAETRGPDRKARGHTSIMFFRLCSSISATTAKSRSRKGTTK